MQKKYMWAIGIALVLFALGVTRQGWWEAIVGLAAVVGISVFVARWIE